MNSTNQHDKTSSGDNIRGAICGAIDTLETGSNTGTYTVDNDGEELAKEGEKVEYRLRESNRLGDNNGLKNQKQEDNSEWVSEWASKTTSMEVKDKDIDFPLTFALLINYPFS